MIVNVRIIQEKSGDDWSFYLNTDELVSFAGQFFRAYIFDALDREDKTVTIRDFDKEMHHAVLGARASYTEDAKEVTIVVVEN